jgi:hypothetical protein
VEPGGGAGSSTGSGNGGTGSGNGGSAGGGFKLPDAGPGGPGAGGSGQTPTEMKNCGLTKIDLMKQPADLMLVLDRSGSMREGIAAGGTGAEKWQEVVAALDMVIMRTQPIVSWGLKVFPATTSQCGVPPGATVPLALNNHAAVMGGVNMNAPPPLAMKANAYTPTQDALRKAVAFMMANPTPHPKYLVLATDGQPNCAGGQVTTNNDTAGSVQAAAASLAAGIPVFVVGVATSGDAMAESALNQMADKGGRPRNDPTTKYYPVASRDQLVTTLETITGQIASCTFPLDKPPPAPNNVAVNIDGMRVQPDPVNGWSYGAGNRSIVLNGALCEKLKSGAAKNVQIIYGCGGDYIP